MEAIFSSFIYLFIVTPFFLDNDFSMRYKIYLIIFILISIFHVYKLIKDLNRKVILSYNQEGVSYISFKETISWDEISDIDLNYERFLGTHILLFCKDKYPWYKKYLSSFNIKEKTKRIEIGLINCDFDEVYYEMHEFLAQHKNLTNK